MAVLLCGMSFRLGEHLIIFASDRRSDIFEHSEKKRLGLVSECLLRGYTQAKSKVSAITS
jgi:hypothetical protein